MSNNFFEEIINNAFKKAKINTKGISDFKEKNLKKLDIIYSYIYSKIDRMYNDISLPSNKFYEELYELLLPDVNIKDLKIRVKRLKENIRKIYVKIKNNMKILKYKEDIIKSRKEFYGRIASILRRNKDILEDYRKYIKARSRIPEIKNYPTIVIAGLPNVGKSTLLKKLTGSNVEIKPYPFTTKDLNLGYIETPYFKLQIVDTPGMLDRPFEELNFIEKKALLALRYLANLVVYVIDLTGTSGYTLEQQINLLKNIEREFSREIVIYFSKYDLFTEKEKKEMEDIAKTLNYPYFHDSESLKNYLVEYIKRKPELYI
ncbi:MAG: GTPase [Nanopusillaceae archaeon]